MNDLQVIFHCIGFLSTADPNSPGNYGILDMAMAIRWVFENIKYFNGDRDSITLFGPDAGAAAAGLLMVNPRTRNMIHRVIAQVYIYFFLIVIYLLFIVSSASTAWSLAPVLLLLLCIICYRFVQVYNFLFFLHDLFFNSPSCFLL